MRHANFRVGVDRAAAAAILAMGVLLASSGCGLDKAPELDPVGPSDTGVSVELSAAPDVVNADGVSESVIRLVLRGQTGQPLAGRPVLFQHDGDGVIAPAPGSSFVGPVQTGLVMATDGDGRASIVYVAGSQIRAVTIWVRPYGSDTALTWERTVEILQR